MQGECWDSPPSLPKSCDLDTCQHGSGPGERVVTDVLCELVVCHSVDDKLVNCLLGAEQGAALVSVAYEARG